MAYKIKRRKPKVEVKKVTNRTSSIYITPTSLKKGEYFVRIQRTPKKVNIVYPFPTKQKAENYKKLVLDIEKIKWQTHTNFQTRQRKKRK